MPIRRVTQLDGPTFPYNPILPPSRAVKKLGRPASVENYATSMTAHCMDVGQS